MRGTILPAQSMLSCSVGYSTVCHLVAGPRDPMLVPQSIQGDGEKGRRKDERRSVLGAEGRSMIRADMALPIMGCPTPPRGCSGAATPDGESSSRARSGLDPFFFLFPLQTGSSPWAPPPGGTWASDPDGTNCALPNYPGRLSFQLNWSLLDFSFFVPLLPLTAFPFCRFFFPALPGSHFPKKEIGAKNWDLWELSEAEFPFGPSSSETSAPLAAGPLHVSRAHLH